MGKVKSIFVLFATCLLSYTLADFTLKEKLVELRAQIQMEMQASIFYQTYAHYYENSDQALHGFAKFFYDQSLEEKKHADKLMTYLNQRNVKVNTLSEITDICDLPIDKKFQICQVVTGQKDSKDPNNPKDIVTALDGILDALKLEKFVLKSLENIITDCKDAQLTHFIEHEYLDEQMQSIKELSDLKSQLKNVENNFVGVLLVDRWLLEGKKHTEL